VVPSNSRVGDRSFADEHLVDCRPDAGAINSGSARRVPLRIPIYQEGAALRRREARRQINSRGGLTDTALLIRDCDDACHVQPMSRVREERRGAETGSPIYPRLDVRTTCHVALSVVLTLGDVPRGTSCPGTINRGAIGLE